MKTNYYGCLEYRNAKYQGSIKESNPKGLGIIVDNRYLFVGGFWEDSNINGPAFIVFPSRQYFYGQVNNKSLEGIGCFVTGKNKYVFNFLKGISERVIHYNQGNNLITTLSYKDNKCSLVSTSTLRQSQKILDEISDKLNVKITKDQFSYFSFLRTNFVDSYDQVVELTGFDKGNSFYGFKNQNSLGVKFDKNQNVSAVGGFQLFPRNLEYGKRIIESNGQIIIEEGIYNNQNPKVSEYKQQRSGQAAKIAEQFFKRGTSYKNSFFSVSLFDSIYEHLKSMIRKVDKQNFLEYGQKIIEDRENEDQYYEKTKQYTLEQMKKQIYKAANRKNSIRPKAYDEGYPTRSLNRSRSKDNTFSKSPSPLLSPSKQSKYKYTKMTQPSQERQQINKPKRKDPVSEFNLHNHHHQPQSDFQYEISQKDRDRIRIREEIEREKLRMKEIEMQKLMMEQMRHLEKMKQEEQQRVIEEYRWRQMQLEKLKEQEQIEKNKQIRDLLKLNSHLTDRHRITTQRKVNYTDRLENENHHILQKKDRTISPIQQLITPSEKIYERPVFTQNNDGEYYNYKNYKNRNKSKSINRSITPNKEQSNIPSKKYQIYKKRGQNDKPLHPIESNVEHYRGTVNSRENIDNYRISIRPFDVEPDCQSVTRRDRSPITRHRKSYKYVD